MRIVVNNNTFGIGTNPRGGEYTKIYLTKQEIEKVSTQETINGYYIGTIYFKPSRWDSDYPYFFVAKISHNLVKNLNVPIDGGRNINGIEFIEELKQQFTWKEYDSEKIVLSTPETPKCFTPCGQDNNCRYNCPDNTVMNWNDWELEHMEVYNCYECNYSE